jgi:hypothetical protein
VPGSKNCYLTVALDYYKYMKIPLALFPKWMKKQYNLDTHARDGFVFLEIQQAVVDLPQAGIWPTNSSANALPHMDIMSVSTPLDSGNMQPNQLPSPLL